MKILAQILNVIVALIMLGFIYVDLFGGGFAKYEWFFYVGFSTFLISFIHHIIASRSYYLLRCTLVLISNITMVLAILYPAISMSLEPGRTNPHLSDVVFFLALMLTPILNIFVTLKLVKLRKIHCAT